MKCSRMVRPSTSWPTVASRIPTQSIGKWLEEVMGHFAAYQHYLTNFSIDVDGDTATARFYVFTQMISIVEGKDVIMSDGGYYDAFAFTELRRMALSRP